MEIIYIETLYYLFMRFFDSTKKKNSAPKLNNAMRHVFKNLYQYEKNISDGSDKTNFCIELLALQNELCEILDKIIDIKNIYEGKVLLYIAIKQDLSNPEQVISQTSIIRTITRNFLGEPRSSYPSIQNALKVLIEKKFIIDKISPNNLHNFKLNIEEYPDLKTFIELIKKWDIPSKYIKAKKEIFQPVEPKGRKISSRKGLKNASVSVSSKRGRSV